jgi:hypothetical protein
MEATTYTTENLIAGKIQTQQVPLAADTYYRGMALEFNSGTGYYEVLSSGSISGIYLGEEATLTAGDFNSVIVGGEVYEGGIVNGSNVALTFTDTILAAWSVRGFYVKKA